MSSLWQEHPSFEYFENLWESRYQDLLAYRKRFGHCMVPQSWSENPTLAGWVSRQRMLKRKDQLPSHREKRLNDINFTWIILDSPSKRTEPKAWEVHFQELLQYVELNSKEELFKEHKKHPIKRWILSQRARYLAEKLKKDKIEKLDQVLGSQWRERKNKMKTWLTYYHELKDFHLLHNHCNVPNKWKDGTLAQWVRDQRYQKEKLVQERVKLLDEINFDWDNKIIRLPNKDWDELYTELSLFYQQYQHSRVPTQKPYGRLAKWLYLQRKHKDTLSKEQIQKLDQLEVNWSVESKEKTKSWEEWYRLLKRFYDKHQHCHVPVSGKNGNPKLVQWIRNQRRLYNQNQLTEEQKDLFNQIGFDQQENRLSRPEYIWRKRYTELQEFYQHFGHADVPEGWKENPQLASWVSYQREVKSKLSKESVDLLNQLQFTWQFNRQLPPAKTWEEMYQQLCQYKEKLGHIHITAPIDRRMQRWIWRQRKHKNKLSKQRKELLEKIGFEWRYDRNKEEEKRWYLQYEKLQGFLSTHQRRPHPKIEEEKVLANWVQNQRRAFKKGKKFTKKQLLQLEQAGIFEDHRYK